MSKCTKGELEAIGNTLYRKQTYIGACVGYFQKSILGDDVDKANAEQLVRRWNAFEEGGLVDELRTTLENALTTLVIISMPRQDDNVATDTELLKILSDSFRAALAKS